VDGEVVGPRHPLFRAAAGEVVFGPDAGSTYKFLAVGVDGTEIINALKDSDFSRFDADHLGAIMDRYVGGLSAWYPFEAPESATTVLDAGAELEAYRNIPVFASSRRVVWIRPKSASDTAALFGDAELRAGTLPVTSLMWATLDDTMVISGVASNDLVAGGQWRQSIDAYIAVFGRFLIGALERMEADAVTRRAARLSVDGSALDAALRDLSAVVRQEEAEPAALAADSALHVAFLAVAREMKIESAQQVRRVPRNKNTPLIEALASAYRIRVRRVMLRDDWWRTDAGPLLAFTETGEPVALVRRGGRGYALYDPASGIHSKLTGDIAEGLQGEAVMLYPPLPAACRTLGDLLRNVSPQIRADLKLVGVMGLAGGMVAALMPIMTSVLIEDVLPSADVEQHIHIILGLVCAALGAASFEVVKAVALLRVEGRADLRLQAAVFDRLLRLPAGFFRRFTVGDLADRVLGIQAVRQIVSGTTIQGLLGVTFATVSLALLLFFNWKLALIAFGLVLIAIVATVYWGRRQLGEERQRIAHQGEVEGFVIQTLTGLGKLRISAAEGRAYARWARTFAKQKRRFFSAQLFANMQDIFHATFPVLATAVIFAAAATFLKSDAIDLQLQALVNTDQDGKLLPMSTGDFVAFNTAFGQFLAAMTALAMALTQSLAAVPIFQRLQPIIEEPLEVASTDKSAQRLRGGIEFSHMSFRYDADGPLILDDFSLTIEPNEFVAIVGPSGSGKSTLIRLLLGFERCEAGEIYFDQTPASTLDMTSVRQQVRVVLQHGQLVSGSIFSNIVGVSSTLTQEDAWRAAKQAGLDEDIEAMPMGMHTIVTEGVNTISGGQRQRLMIARALVHRPRILLLDEPTSALDNRTQDIVMETLMHLTATRIVIAHRLSTVRAADRIVVVDKGKILQSGTFEELMAEEGPFKEMARRQLV
ncbi:MAG: NHLP bacteriocin export ABC transporter permease/ATPase subunit, partial [Rhodospirillales bacterium]